MKNLFVLIVLAVSLPASAQLSAVNGWCEQGAKSAVVSGMNSTNELQGIIPGCTVTPYLTGTTTLATYYLSPNGTPQTGPFTANATTGQYVFYAATGVGLDVVRSSGTIQTDVIAGGGSGGNGTVNSGTTGQAAMYPSNGTVVQGGTLGIGGGGTGATTAAGAQYNFAAGGVGSFPIPNLVASGSSFDNAGVMNTAFSATPFLGHFMLPSTAQGIGTGLIAFSRNLLVSQSSTIIEGAGWSFGSAHADAYTGMTYTGTGLTPTWSSGVWTIGSRVMGSDGNQYVCIQAATTQNPVGGPNGYWRFLQAGASPESAFSVNCSSQSYLTCHNVEMKNFTLRGQDNAQGDGIALEATTGNYQNFLGGYEGSQFLADHLYVSAYTTCLSNDGKWDQLKIGSMICVPSTASTGNDWIVNLGYTCNSCQVDKLQINGVTNGLLAPGGKGFKAYIGDTNNLINVSHVGQYWRFVNGTGSGADATITATWSGGTSGTLTGLAISGGSGYWPRVWLSFSSSTCTVYPTAMIYTGANGVPTGLYKIVNPGSCSVGSATVTVPDPTATASGTIEIGDAETPKGYLGFVDAGSSATYIWNGNQGSLSTLQPPFQVWAGTTATLAQLTLRTSRFVSEVPAATVTTSVTPSGGYFSAPAYFGFVGSGTVNGATLNSSISTPVACNVTVGSSTCIVTTPSTLSGATSCDVYELSTTSGFSTNAQKVGTVTCGSSLTVLGNESLGANPPVGNVPLIQMVGNNNTAGVNPAGILPVNVICNQPRADGINGNAGSMLLAGNGAYLDACSMTGKYYTTSLPAPSLAMTNKQVIVYNSSGVLNCYVGKSASVWSPDTCSSPAIGGTSTAAPLWLQNVGTGSDESCDLGAGGTGCSSLFTGDTTNTVTGYGNFNFSNFTVESAATVSVTNIAGLVIHASGTCTINGILKSGTTAGTTYVSASSGGASGWGAATGTTGGSIYMVPGANGLVVNTGGTAMGSATNCTSGCNGATESTNHYRARLNSGTNDGMYWAGADGFAGGSSGGAKGIGGAGITLICGAIAGSGSISTNGGNGSNGGSNTGPGSGGGAGDLTLSSQASTTFSTLTLSATGGSPGAVGTGSSYTGGSGGNGHISTFSGW